MKNLTRKFNSKAGCFDYYIDDICIGEVTFSNGVSWTAENIVKIHEDATTRLVY